MLVSNTAALKKEAGFSERLHASYQSTQCHNAEDRKENLRSKVRNVLDSDKPMEGLLTYVGYFPSLPT